MPPLIYPKANYIQGNDGGSFQRDDPISKGTLHTTETRGVPAYANPPHNTVYYSPYTKRVSWYQHVKYDRAARALRNLPGGEQTNREDRNFQLEIVCYSNEQLGASVNGLLVGSLPKVLLDEIREWMIWMEANYNIQPIRPTKQAFSYLQANAPGFRMTASEWDSWPGWCGHQHVLENVHWDPGALNWDYLMIRDMTTPTPPIPPEEDEMQSLFPLKRANAKTQGDGTRASDVAYYAALLERSSGLALPNDGSWPDSMVNLIAATLGGNGTYITGNMAAALTFTLLNQNKGEKGDRGPRGATGATGAKGDAGARGPAGLAGVDGKDGTDGTDSNVQIVVNGETVYSTEGT